MKFEKIRIYAEVLEQGLDFKNYIQNLGFTCEIQNIYTKKIKTPFSEADSLVDKIRKAKDVDVLITVIAGEKEYPILMIEYSTAVPTDDHKMQRADVYFWSSIFKVPIMKISPNSKGMENDFGGGSKFTDNLEISLSHKMGAIFYPIEWKNCENSSCLEINPNSLSCIKYTNEICEILKECFTKITDAENYSKYYSEMLKSYEIKYQNILKEYENFDLKSVIVNSSRFNWLKEKLCIKINRFGHAMDPDRGALYFVNMLVGTKNTIAEIQINRPEQYDCKGGYKSLFDGTSRKDLLESYIKNIIKNKNNIFSEDDAIYVLLNALNIGDNLSFEKKSDKEYFIQDEILEKFLITYPGMVPKSIFYLANELRLTDKNRKIICTIKWNNEPITKFFEKTQGTNYRKTTIQPLKMKQAKEDIITFSSAELYKKLNHDLLAISYPGAQGDRCILCGEGRNISRTYVDIITSLQTDCGVKIFLHESKEKLTDSIKDVDKLNNIFEEENLKGLFLLCKKVANIDLMDKKNIYICVAAKKSDNISIDGIDYVFDFDIKNNETKTIVEYSINILNPELEQIFSPLLNKNKKYQGTMEFDLIYTIND